MFHRFQIKWQSFSSPRRCLTRLFLLSIIVSLVLQSAAQLTSVRSQNAAVTASSADDFLDAIGVNLHFNSSRPEVRSFNTVKAKLEKLGIRHIRDGATGNRYDYANQLYDAYGIRTTWITGRRFPGPWPQRLDPSQIDDELNEIKTRSPEATVAIEGPNEYDIMRPRSPEDDAEWPARVRDYQQQVYVKSKDDPLLQTKDVIGPSLTSEAAYNAVGNLEDYLDYACIHHYQSWRHPGTGGWGANGYGSITWAINRLIRVQAPNKPFQSTECGYANVTDGISDRGEGLYLPRMFAEFYRRGYSRSFKYELVDGDPETALSRPKWGLLRQGLSEKPSYVALRNLLALLKDATWNPATRTWVRPAFAPGALDYTLSGSTTNVRQLLLQKSNGSFYLLLWREIASWDGINRREIINPEVSVTLTLNTPIAYAATNRPNDSATWSSAAIVNNQINLSVPDKLLIVRLTPPDSNADPTVRLTSPDDNNFITPGSDITLAARASDQDGEVVKVEFFEGSTKLGEDTTAPYSFDWNNAPSGRYVLTARATDNAGATVSSAPIDILVADHVSTSYEAESGTFGNGARVDSDPAASGGEFVTWLHPNSAYVQINNVDGGSSGGRRWLRIRYAHAQNGPTWKGLIVNGQRITQLTFVPTASWTTFGDLITSVTLNPGTDNTIRIENQSWQGDGGGVSIDKFDLISVLPTVRFSPTEDAYVRGGTYADTNYGTSTTLDVKTVSNLSYQRDAYLKFDLSTVNSISTAKLRIYAAQSIARVQPPSVTMAVYSVADTSWCENMITWNTKPARGTTALASTNVSGTTYAWYEIDVTNYVKAEKADGRNLISLALRNPSSSEPVVRINSREAAANKPELIVTQ